ncbi:hypothetical protein DI005_08390 [Prauserella sp. PE36]|uniref:SnoaL-like domain-containing protein n=1 Tax=Prauserella endophytica TaxID=1592324 RepID=A0ABY2S5P3_9PSEU|nr:nuclear transport factor 2 family protein [Prauserella endophytica]RBM21793.1 hypothetical protein DI005_08390 [Prauserella sp. PE36]TKG70986.1 hypothetical protein FCN18_15870 [Prauserella endophytica]
MNRIRETTARAEVRAVAEQLLYTYAAAADELDIETLTELLSEAQVNFAGRAGTGAEFVASLFGDLFANAPRVRHLVSNVRVWEAVDTAGAISCSATCRYTRWSYEPQPELLSMGDYSARFIEAEGQWSFQRFQVEPLWSAPPR